MDETANSPRSDRSPATGPRRQLTPEDIEDLALVAVRDALMWKSLSYDQTARNVLWALAEAGLEVVPAS